MPRITFVSADGIEHLVDAPLGQSVMELAKSNGIDEILGQCGGLCACPTCHVYIDPAWQGVVGAPSEDEAEMLDFASDRRSGSRLSCQVRIRPEYDGLVVHTPARQR